MCSQVSVNEYEWERDGPIKKEGAGWTASSESSTEECPVL